MEHSAKPINIILRKVVQVSLNRAIANHEKRYEKDGKIYCGVCNQPITTQQIIQGYKITMGISCICDKKRQQQQEQGKLQQEINIKRDKAIKNKRYKTAMFSNPQTKDSPVNRHAKKYCDEWESNKKQGKGLLLCGGVGTGKTWASYCIANALIDKNASVHITTFPELFSRCKEHWNKTDTIISYLTAVDMLIIDDLGAEAFTNYNAQITFQIINTRYNQLKPMIISTNLNKTDMQNNSNVEYKRVFDRLLQMGDILEVTGNSCRVEEYINRFNQS